jgi:hypothetical protein
MESETYWENETISAYEEQVRTVLDFTKYNFNPTWYPGDTPDPNAGVITQGRPLMTGVQLVLYQGATYEEAAEQVEQKILDALEWED